MEKSLDAGKGGVGQVISKQTSSVGAFFSMDFNGNPSYTIKDGGTLKKKVQPMAASKAPRIPEPVKSKQVTAPGSYDLPGDIAGL